MSRDYWKCPKCEKWSEDYLKCSECGEALRSPTPHPDSTGMNRAARRAAKKARTHDE